MYHCSSISGRIRHGSPTYLVFVVAILEPEATQFSIHSAISLSNSASVA